MTDVKALKELLAKVEAGEWDCLDENYPLHYSTYPNFGRTYEDGSLDAAKALHEALLTGWDFWVTTDRTDVFLGENGPRQYGMSDIPARAWLLAIIRALIAEDEE